MKTVTIKGKLYRPLELGERVQPTDMWGPNGHHPFQPFGRVIGFEVETCAPGKDNNLLRPLPKNPAKKPAKGKSFTRFILRHGNSYGNELFVRKCDVPKIIDDTKVLRVRITPL